MNCKIAGKLHAASRLASRSPEIENEREKQTVCKQQLMKLSKHFYNWLVDFNYVPSISH